MSEIIIASDNPFESKLIRQALTDKSWTLTIIELDSFTVPELHRLHPDLIILGTHLAVNGGLQTCRAIRRDPALEPTPILLLTAPGQIRQHVLGNIDLDVNDFINVPFDEIELSVRVQNLLNAKRTQDELRRTRQNQNELFEMLVHDIGNMVTILTSALSFYHHVPTTSPQAAQAVLDAYESSLILARMLTDLLDVARLESKVMPVRRQITNVPMLLQTTAKLMQSAALDKAVVFDVLIGDDAEVFAQIDSSLLQRIVTNLLLNAVNYSPERSHVTVSLATLWVAGLPARLKISISDQGPGISLQQQADIFDKTRLGRYYTERTERIGHGLGLIFCRLAAEAHGGTITVESTPGQGSAFTLDLPYR